MNGKLFKPFLSLGAFVLVVSMACSILSPEAKTTPLPPTAQEVVAPVVTQAVVTQAVVTQAPQPAQPDAGGLVTTVEDMQKAVVNIYVEGSYRDPEEGWQVNLSKGGSGFIIDPSGIVVTNNHVVTGAALVKVILEGEDTPRNARVLGVSECSDLAVLDVDGDGFNYLQWYGGEIKAGMDVYAAGFPGSAAGVGYTLTKGIISKADAPLDWIGGSVTSSIEHTAKINPGNSGGPLVSSNAEVVGVNTASNQQDQQYSVSVKTARSLVEELRTGKDIDSVGVNGVAVSGSVGETPVSGIWVRSVKSGSPADKARIQPGDIILQVESQILAEANMKDYCSVLRAHNPGDTLSITVLRWDTKEVFKGQLNGRELEYSHTLEGGDQGNSGNQGNSGDSGNQSDVPGTFLNVNASQPGEYIYKDEFDVLDNWIYWLQRGREKGFTQEAKDGKFRTNIKDEETYVYYRYEGLKFTDVRMDTRVENLGANTNFTGLFCRYSSDGWYEVDILSSGEFAFYYYDALGKSGYNLLYSGASRLIKLGKDINDYTLVCKGENLVLGINGTEVKTVPMKTGAFPVLREGQVGLFVSSENIVPVIIEFDWFYASVPQ